MRRDGILSDGIPDAETGAQRGSDIIQEAVVHALFHDTSSIHHFHQERAGPARGLWAPRAALNAAQHEFVTFLKTL